VQAAGVVESGARDENRSANDPLEDVLRRILRD
jgi:hypothetical protein